MELLKINYLFGWLESHRSAAKICKKRVGRAGGEVETENEVGEKKYDGTPTVLLIRI